MGDEEVALPLSVERMIEEICLEQCQSLPDPDARKILASIGEDNSMHMLKIISQRKIITFSGFIKYMLKDYKPKPSISNALLPPQHPSTSPTSGMDGSIFHSPFPKYLLLSPSSSDKTDTPIARGGSSSTIGQKRVISVTAQLLASPLGNSCSTTRKKLNFSSLVDTIPENMHIDTNRESTLTITKQWHILSGLEFRKSFLILNYIGRKKLENVVSEEDAYKILKMKDYPMERFELEIWTMYGRFSFVGSEFTERRKYLDWECGKTYHYHCHVWRDGSLSFKGPYLKSTKTLLHRTFGDENILIVKFEEQARSDSTICSGDYNALYDRVAKEGILIGQRRFRFFVFKDGDRKGKKKSPTTSDAKCYFIRMEFIAPCDVKDPYNLSNKTVHEARCLFMHLHTTSSMAKYASRCSLILSQTIKVEVNLDTIYIERIEDIPCQDDNGISVCNEDGDLLIHTDGTGFISEDLAMKCPRAFLSARYRKAKNSEMEDESLEGKLSDAHVREPPLLMQCRLFYNGCAVKGTFLVNRKIRPSMIKVEADPNFKGETSVNSLEVVNISRKPGKSRLSKYLIALLYFGGVPEQFFLNILADALEDTQRLFSDKRSAVRASVNHGTLDDDFPTARIILSGVPLDEPCVQHRLSHLAFSERKGLREGRLPISESFFLMGTADPTGLLKSDEVCVILDNGQISGKVLVYRYPGLHFGDVHVLNAVYLKELEDVVGNAKYGIFFSTKGQRSVASEIANGDFDGDMYWVSKNCQLLHYFKESTPWTRMHSSSNFSCEKPSDFPCDVLEDKLFKQFLDTKNRNISMGVAADSWMAFTDKFLTLDDNSYEKNNLKEKMLKLIDIYYDALDAPKSGKEIKVPNLYRANEYPHYMEKGKEYRSGSVLGKICDAVDTYIPKRTLTHDCSAESAIDDVKAAKIVGEILALPLDHRVWPNCMDRPIRHSAPVDAAAFASKLLLKSAVGKEFGGSESQSRATRSTAVTKDKGKGIVITPLDTQIDTISSDSTGTPEAERMVNSGRQFIKEYKPPVIRALEMSGKELFLKRARESGSETPKSSRKMSSASSPQSKKAKVVVPPPPPAVMDATPEIVLDDWQWPDLHRYSVNAEPKSLVNILAPLLLPETVSGHGSRTVDQVMVEAVGHSFHAFQAMLLSHASYRKFSNELAELKLEHSSCEEKIRVLQEQVFLAHKETNEMRNELTIFAAKVEETEGAFLQETKDTLTQGIMKSRVETMLEFRRGEWDDKDTDEAVRIYNEAYPDDPVNPGDDGGNAAVGGSSVIARNVQEDNESEKE